MEVRRLTARKEEIYRQLLGERTPLVPAGARHLIDVLGKHQVLHLLEGCGEPDLHLSSKPLVLCAQRGVDVAARISQQHSPHSIALSARKGTTWL